MAPDSIPQVRSRLRTAAAVLVTALAALAFGAREVVLQFHRIYQDLGAELPWLTRQFLDLGGGWPFLAAIALGIALSAAWLDGRARAVAEVAAGPGTASVAPSLRLVAAIRSWGTWAWVIAILALAGTITLGAVVLFLPLMSLKDGGNGL